MNLSNLSFPIEQHRTWEITDGSKLKTFATCPRQFFFEYVLGWRREAPNNHLIFGDAWHLAMEHLLLHGFSKDSILAAYEAFETRYRESLGPDTDELFSPKNPMRAFDALVDYYKEYQDRDLRYQTLETEIAGKVVFNEDFTLHYRMDSILLDIEKDLIFSREHKTASRFNQQWTMQWALSFQVWIYTHVLYCLYKPERVRGVSINGVAFKKVKDNSKASKHEFLRVPVWKTPDQMQSGYEDILYFLGQLKNEYEILAEASTDDSVLRAFPRNPESCTKYFGCTWHDFCTSWSNPLHYADEPPLGFMIERWDPSKGEAKHIHDITPNKE